jgi:hypothetical protein
MFVSQVPVEFGSVREDSSFRHAGEQNDQICKVKDIWKLCRSAFFLVRPWNPSLTLLAYINLKVVNAS